MTTRTARSQRALDRAVEAAQERHTRIWNAQIKRMEDAERKNLAEADRRRRSALRVVR